MASFEEFFSSSWGALSGIPLGRPVMGKPMNSMEVRLPLSSMNKHGLIAGSTGTGKSRALQLIAESLAEQGVSVFLSDVKGDVSGFFKPGSKARAASRAADLGVAFAPKRYRTNLWSLSSCFSPMRLCISDLSPVLVARLLSLNSTQESHLSMLFIFAKEKGLRHDDFSDIMGIAQYLKDNPREASGISSQSMDVIIRKIAVMVDGGIDDLFGQPSIGLSDIMEPGAVNVLNLSDVRSRPELLGITLTFLLYKMFSELPDIGDTAKPKMVIFIDEAHYLFEGANPSLIELVVTMLRQIRSKGVGVFFVTQNAEDLGEKVLSLLGCKIQFAMRAFTEGEQKDLRAMAQGYPKSAFYDLQEEVKSLPVGTAFVSVLDMKGGLLPPVKTSFFPPKSFMDVPSDAEFSAAANKKLRAKYLQKIKADGNPAEGLANAHLGEISAGGRNSWEVRQQMLRMQEKANPPFFISFPRAIGSMAKNSTAALAMVLIIVLLIFLMFIAGLFAFGFVKIG